jgi:hypothetical protein
VSLPWANNAGINATARRKDTKVFFMAIKILMLGFFE